MRSVVLGIGVILSVALVVHMWTKRRAPFFRKLFWTVVLFVPYLGPLFYGALFNPLSPQGEHLQDRYGWGSMGADTHHPGSGDHGTH
jgi:low temperature requirement protein LtrA